jgi:hypothetical protein
MRAQHRLWKPRDPAPRISQLRIAEIEDPTRGADEVPTNLVHAFDRGFATG